MVERMVLMIEPAKALRIARLALDIATGDRQDAVNVVRELMILAADMIPVDELKEFLTDRDRIFADLSADVAEQIKLDGSDKR